MLYIRLWVNKLIKDIFIQSSQTYGTRRLKEAVVQRYGLVLSKRRFKVTNINSNHNFAIAHNRINRDFYSLNPNDKYVGDITYIKTKQGVLYLSTVIIYIQGK